MSVISTSERQNHVENSHDGSRQRTDEATKVHDKQPTKKEVGSVHAAKRKKLARNDNLIGNDCFEVVERMSPTADTAAADRKLISTAETPDRKTSAKPVSDRVPSPTVVEKPRVVTDTAVETNEVGHVISEKQDRHVDVDRPSSAAATTGNGLVAEKADDKARADILDDIDDDVADSFALFATIKSTSGAEKTANEEEELPVSQPQVSSRTASYDQLSSGGATIAMADSGYQTYDHDLSELNDRQSQLVPEVHKPEVPSELELQSSISEPDMADTVARYSASSDSEMSVELPSCASSPTADKPTSLDWQVLQQVPAAALTTHDETTRSDDRQTGKIARRASEEDLDQTRSAVYNRSIYLTTQMKTE